MYKKITKKKITDCRISDYFNSVSTISGSPERSQSEFLADAIVAVSTLTEMVGNQGGQRLKRKLAYERFPELHFLLHYIFILVIFGQVFRSFHFNTMEIAKMVIRLNVQLIRKS